MIARALIVVAIAACHRLDAEPAIAPSPEEPPVGRLFPERAKAVIARFECNRCHDVPEIAPPPRDKQCFGCHQEVFEGTFPASTPSLAKWKPHVEPLRYAPALSLADRLRRDWIVDYLLAPHDVRPGSVAQMPALWITREQAREVAWYLVPREPEPQAYVPQFDQAERGRELYERFACARCHRFSGTAADDRAAHAAGKAQVAPLDVAWQLAPDLAWARYRMEPAAIVDWIVRPRGMMPNLGVDEGDARALAAFIYTTEWKKPAPERDPNLFDARGKVRLLDRPVTWAEVEKEVFRETCWHCHSSPDFARGDGGPGNTGGFGFRGRGFDVSSYAAISSGSFDARGERRSVFVPAEPGERPLLLEALLSRHTEETDRYARVPITGMPLGMPPLSADKIRLVATWIAQGRPN